jgi:hypothetical protein
MASLAGLGPAPGRTLAGGAGLLVTSTGEVASGVGSWPVPAGLGPATAGWLVATSAVEDAVLAGRGPGEVASSTATTATAAVAVATPPTVTRRRRLCLPAPAAPRPPPHSP